MIYPVMITYNSRNRFGIFNSGDQNSSDDLESVKIARITFHVGMSETMEMILFLSFFSGEF